jgi:hypothetical protein
MRKKTQKELQDILDTARQYRQYSQYNDSRLCAYGNWHEPLEECNCANKPEEPGYPAILPEQAETPAPHIETYILTRMQLWDRLEALKLTPVHGVVNPIIGLIKNPNPHITPSDLQEVSQWILSRIKEEQDAQLERHAALMSLTIRLIDSWKAGELAK